MIKCNRISSDIPNPKSLTTGSRREYTCVTCDGNRMFIRGKSSDIKRYVLFRAANCCSRQNFFRGNLLFCVFLTLNDKAFQFVARYFLIIEFKYTVKTIGVDLEFSFNPSIQRKCPKLGNANFLFFSRTIIRWGQKDIKVLTRNLEGRIVPFSRF